MRINMLVEELAGCYSEMPMEFTSEALRPLIAGRFEKSFGVSPTTAELDAMTVDRTDLRGDKGPVNTAQTAVAKVGKEVLVRWFTATPSFPVKLAIWIKLLEEGEVSELSASSVRDYRRAAKKLELPRPVRPYGFVQEMLEAEDARMASDVERAR